MTKGEAIRKVQEWRNSMPMMPPGMYQALDMVLRMARESGTKGG